MMEWKCYDGLWCKSACTHLPFVLDNLNDHAVVDATKVLCELKGHRGFSYGGSNIFFIPGEISDSKCEVELEEGRNESIYTYVRSVWHKVDEMMLTEQEKDMLVIEDAVKEGSNSCSKFTAQG